MLAKYTQCGPPLTPSCPAALVPDYHESLVLRALKYFLPGTAHGPSGLWANHLKEAVSCSSPSRRHSVLLFLARVVQLLASSLAPPEFVPH